MSKNHKKNNRQAMNMNPTEKEKAEEEALKAREEAALGEEPAVEEETAEAEESAEAEQWEQKVAEAEEKLAAEQDKYLRLAAEFDNFRRRTLKEKSELIKSAGEKVITAILPVLDDMERAIGNMKKTGDAEALLEGVELIYNKFLKVLQQEGLKKIETEGQEFNTDYHEAIAMVPAPSEAEKGKILDCVQTGYMLNDKVIRHAKVAVAQ